jgi:predicted GNAT superfamily acetyltransferase
MTGASDDGLVIRDVRTHEEFVACVELQAATWGAGFRESVPATILKISQRLGGVTAGAFTADGTLVGFVFGMTGIERGALVHWSDMLAVREGLQNHGLGRRLKAFQRDAVRALGVTRMYWTYDPLVARNAHFNLNRLGARVSEYVPDMYGTDTGSAMHSGFGTDRFIVVWPIAADDSPADVGLADAVRYDGDAPVLNDGTTDGRDVDVVRFGAALPPVVRVEIPPDIFRVQGESVARAIRWRATTRHAFQWALASGYTVRGFEQDPAAGRGFYRLSRD